MTIVASNSLTVSNINDGTITHYAYAYSADGKDGFYVGGGGTNLLFNSNFSSGLANWHTNLGNNKDGKAVVTTDSDGDTCIHITGTGASCGIYSSPSPFNQNQITTGSVLAKGTGRIRVVGLESRLTSNFGIVSTESYSKVGSTTQASSNTNAFVVYFSPVNNVVDVYIKFVKLEQGDKDTPWSPAPSEAHPSYIGQYTDFSSTASTDPSKYAPWIIFKGDDGTGIKTTTITYAGSTSGTTAPTSGWTTTVPTVAAGSYLWTKTVWTYTDNSSETGYSVTYISKDGNNGNDGVAGKDGVGILTTTITYAGSTSGTTAPTSGWTSTVPTVAAGSYLWTKTVWAYTDNTSETGYSVAKMGNNGATGPQGPQGNTGPQGLTGPSGVDGDPGKVVSDTEPTTRFKGLTWKYSGTADLTASDGTVIHLNTEYYYNGTNWMINYLSANNIEANSIKADKIDAKNLTITDGEFVSTTTNGPVTTSTEIKDNHIAISKTDGTVNTRNDIALDSEQGLAQKFTNIDTGFYRTAGINYQGPFTSDSDGNYAQLTPQGTKLSTDVPWTILSPLGGFSGGLIRFAVKNGVAHFSLAGLSCPSMTAGNWIKCAQLPTGSIAIPSENQVTAAFTNATVWGFYVSKSGGLYLQSTSNSPALNGLVNASNSFPIG
ncbi:collagen-like protein [Lactococcus lactis]|uniref:Collagen-like protein n=1 Tax=Lactococcus lactis TaxID=1358 RepID=A0AAE4NQF7_9LACT|nr:collagen-like protein [Lactococcus lactis]MDV2632784.1 collagen-like protein [Lactococcus lactis]